MSSENLKEEIREIPLVIHRPNKKNVVYGTLCGIVDYNLTLC